MKIQNTVRLVLTTPLSDREIADAVGVSKTTVGRYRRLAAAKQFVWADLAQLRPTELAKRFNRDPNGNKTRKAPDFAEIQQRLDEGHTLQVLWEDYRREDPHHTLSYSQLAARMRRYRKTLPTALRMAHEPAYKAYVDFAGFKRIPLPTYLDATTLCGSAPWPRAHLAKHPFAPSIVRNSRWWLVRALRETAGMTQTEFAEKLGRTQSFVSAAERGAKLDTLQIRDWCQACGTDLVAWAKAVEAALAGEASPEEKGQP